VSLDVHMFGGKVGSLRPHDDGYVFAYDPRAVDSGAGRAPLSTALPLGAGPFSAEATRAYVEGLLPQGGRRRAIAGELGIDPDDGYALIAELGRDCPGAVTFLPEGEEAEPGDSASLAWLDDEELEEVLQPRPPQLFDSSCEQRMRFALPGERHKLALVYDEEGDRWAWPEPGAPSTHILKPEAPERPGLVANEHACTLAYRELGIPVVHTSVETIAGQTCLLSKRFDRWGEGPRAECLHQESFAQALGVAPDDADGRLSIGTPTLGEASGVLRAIGEEGACETLMKATFCDLLIGCTELRGANSALLFAGAEPMLAPFYDIVSTEVYGEVRPRPIVIGDDVPPAPLLIDLVHTIRQCGFDFQPAIIESVRVMGRVCIALGSIAEAAHEEGWYRRAIDEAVQLATGRTIEFFEEEADYMRPPGGEPLS
jgi:serine/threonine-protein kinase HipA